MTACAAFIQDEKAMPHEPQRKPCPEPADDYLVNGAYRVSLCSFHHFCALGEMPRVTFERLAGEKS
jgi:hypothetical protein